MSPARDQGRIGLQDAAAQLGLHYMTVYRYVRTGRLPAERDKGQWWVQASDLRELEHPSAHPRGTGKRRAGSSGIERRLIAGDEAGAWSVVEAALASGASPDEVYLRVLSPALRSIGDRWRSGELTVGDEHRASAVAVRLVGRLGARFARRGRKRRTIVLASPPGELHAVPLAMVADMLRWRGFEVVELGVDTPADDVAAAAVHEKNLVAVAIGCTTPGSSGSAAEVIAAVRRARPDVAIVVGGAGIATRRRALALGADHFTGATGDGVVEVIEAIAAGEVPGVAR